MSRESFSREIDKQEMAWFELGLIDLKKNFTRVLEFKDSQEMFLFTDVEIDDIKRLDDGRGLITGTALISKDEE